MNLDMPDTKSLARKKVLGVPVLYLAGGGVVILAVYAWRAKSTVKPLDASDESDEEAGTIGGELYPNMPKGTVIVAPADMTAGTAEVEDTNEDWIRRGVAFLGTQGVGAGAAQEALQAYLEGAQLSFEQGAWRDKTIASIGMPPWLGTVGGTAPAPVAAPAATPPVDFAQTVRDAYSKFLGRDAGAAEIDAWTSSGVGVVDVPGQVSGSPEGQVQSLFRKYLGRNAGASEIAIYVPISRSHGWAHVEMLIRESDEAKARRG